METLTVNLRTQEDAYNLAIRYGASELLAACIATECQLPLTTLYKRDYETPLGALIVECLYWRETELGFEFWDLIYSSLISPKINS